MAALTTFNRASNPRGRPGILKASGIFTSTATRRRGPTTKKRSGARPTGASWDTTTFPTTADRRKSVAPNNWHCQPWVGLGSPGHQTANPSVQTLSPYGRRLPFGLGRARAGLWGWGRVRGPEVSQWYAVVRQFLGAVRDPCLSPCSRSIGTPSPKAVRQQRTRRAPSARNDHTHSRTHRASRRVQLARRSAV